MANRSMAIPPKIKSFHAKNVSLIAELFCESKDSSLAGNLNISLNKVDFLTIFNLKILSVTIRWRKPNNCWCFSLDEFSVSLSKSGLEKNTLFVYFYIFQSFWFFGHFKLTPTLFEGTRESMLVSHQVSKCHQRQRYWRHRKKVFENFLSQERHSRISMKVTYF